MATMSPQQLNNITTTAELVDNITTTAELVDNITTTAELVDNITTTTEDVDKKITIGIYCAINEQIPLLIFQQATNDSGVGNVLVTKLQIVKNVNIVVTAQRWVDL